MHEYASRKARPGYDASQAINANGHLPFQTTAGNAAALGMMDMDGDDSGVNALGRAVAPKLPGGQGLPEELRGGIERMSGLSMENVQVHYDSSLPSRMGARAYASGTDIHIAPGQERELPHEAWHVVQQMRGRVEAQGNIGDEGVNIDSALENEASLMGSRAEHGAAGYGEAASLTTASVATPVVQGAGLFESIARLQAA